MISVERLSYSFPQKDLFEDISFTIEDGEHCVLVGSNGTGKSTLADILVNTDNYVLHRGKIKKTPGMTCGFVSQFVLHEESELSVFAYLSEHFVKLLALADDACMKLETAENYDKAAEEYQAILDRIDAEDGYNYESNIAKLLAGAGLSRLSELSVSAISGGEFKLIRIIREMLTSPDLLVMDEPDAFLDFENIAGLRDLINSYEGTMLVITHSRFLLNTCFDKVLHLENEGIRQFEGSYTEYTFAMLQMKAELMQTTEKEDEWIEIQEQLVEKLRDDAEKVPDTYRGKRLRARVSYLDRLLKHRSEKPFLENRRPQISFKSKEIENPDDVVLSVEHFNVSYDEPLLEDVCFEIGATDKVAFVGRNGSGKTTLMRAMVKGGEGIQVKGDVTLSFLSQIYGDTLHENISVREEIEEHGIIGRENVIAFLQSYALDGEIIDCKIKTLSGGEKNLLQLALISLGDAPLLLLDEPTSHLDLYSQLALEKAIREYSGAVVMVSHDFYSIANCADYILLFENNTVRRMSARAFRKSVYKKYFSLEYLELEQKKKELELKINALLREHKHKEALQMCKELEEIIQRIG